MTGALVERDELSQVSSLSAPAASPPNVAPRRVSSAPPDGVKDNGATVTVHVQGKSYELTNEQLDEAARRVAAEGAHKPRAGNIAADQLRSIVERIENLESEKAGLAADIRDIYAESKGNGFCVKTIRKIIALRKLDAAERDEAEALLDTYKHALGIGPLFDE